MAIAQIFSESMRRFLKIHAVSASRDATLWCHKQLYRTDTGAANKRLRERLISSGQWLRGSLLEMDLVFIGFWSDWKHLSKLLMAGIRSVNVPFVLLVDPAPTDELKAKAPELWRWASRSQVNFQHISEKGADFLAELRRLYSVNFLERAALSAQDSFKRKTGAQHSPTLPFSGLDRILTCILCGAISVVCHPVKSPGPLRAYSGNGECRASAPLPAACWSYHGRSVLCD